MLVMADLPSKRYQDQLSRIKTNVRGAYEYFKPNYDRYNEFRRFVFESSLKEEEITLLNNLSRPTLEFNVLEAYVSRLLGEFSKQEPDIMVSADNENDADPTTIEILEQHLRHTFSDAKNDHTRYDVYKDLLSGGFSVFKVTTDYANSKSFNQVINVERAFDPTLCGFDKLSKFSHKGDGQFCFELFPMEKEQFKQDYPDIAIDTISFRRDFEGFNWSYLADKSEVLLVCDYYEKKRKKVKIVQLRDGRVMTLKKYDQMVAEWDNFDMPPVIVGKPRTTELETIVRYRLIENQVIEYVETDFTMFPLIFVDGNSILIKTPKNGNVRQMTRPYVYHAKSAQRLKNFAGISLANEIENIVQHKFIVAKEALPKEQEFRQAYKDIQKASVLVANAFYEENPDQPIPNPIREVAKVPAPPEILQAFSGSDSMIQNILGSYDASLGINNNQLSGIAIVEAATQSNSAAMPYIVGFMHGLQRVAEIYIDLFPKYYTTPRTIPVMDKDGKRDYIKINQDNGYDMFYDSNALNVIVKAGASFQVQKSRTIMMVKEMMGMSPLFQQFIAEKGLNFVLDNMEGKGIEQLKAMVDEWLKEYEAQKQAQMKAQQQQLENNPAVMKEKNKSIELQLKAQKDEADFHVDMAKLQQDQMKVFADLEQSKQNGAVQLVKAQTEQFAKQVDLLIKDKDQKHRHLKEAVEVHHKISSSRERDNEQKKTSNME
jgi:hypothetical protein